MVNLSHTVDAQGVKASVFHGTLLERTALEDIGATEWKELRFLNN